MGAIFVTSKRHGYINAAHIIKVDEGDFATLTNGEVVELDVGWMLEERCTAFSGLRDCEGSSILDALGEIKHELHVININS